MSSLTFTLFGLAMLNMGCTTDFDGDGLTSDRDCDDQDPDVGYDLFEGTLDSDWETFCAEATCLREIHGDLLLSEATQADVDSLSCLGAVKGHLEIHSNEAIRNLNALENLETVEGWLELHGKGPKTLEGLRGLREVGVLHLYHSPAKTLDGLENLTTVTAKLQISYASMLNDVSALHTLELVDGDFAVIGNQSLCPSSVEKLMESIPEITGSISVHTNECE